MQIDRNSYFVWPLDDLIGTFLSSQFLGGVEAGGGGSLSVQFSGCESESAFLLLSSLCRSRGFSVPDTPHTLLFLHLNVTLWKVIFA